MNKYDKDRAIFWHYPVYHHDVPASAVRKGDWKLINYLNNDIIELYNLAEDIGETTDRRDLKEYFPEVTAVIDATDHATGDNPYYKMKLLTTPK